MIGTAVIGSHGIRRTPLQTGPGVARCTALRPVARAGVVGTDQVTAAECERLITAQEWLRYFGPENVGPGPAGLTDPRDQRSEDAVG